VKEVSKLASTAQFLAVLAFRMAAGPGRPVVFFDIVPFGALVVIVVDFRAGLFRVKRGYFAHCYIPFLR
jgi:hypothetical protein